MKASGSNGMLSVDLCTIMMHSSWKNIMDSRQFNISHKTSELVPVAINAGHNEVLKK